MKTQDTATSAGRNEFNFTFDLDEISDIIAKLRSRESEAAPPVHVASAAADAMNYAKMHTAIKRNREWYR